MAGITLVVANGNWPQSDLVETLLEMSDFTIALDELLTNSRDGIL